MTGRYSSAPVAQRSSATDAHATAAPESNLAWAGRRQCACGAPADTARGMCSRCYHATRAHLLHAGKWVPDRVDPRRAIGHLQALVAAGRTGPQIARLCGIDRKRVRYLIEAGNGLRPPPEYIWGRVETALLAVTIPGMVPGHGTIRRARSLIAFGYPPQQLAQELGLPLKALCTAYGRAVWTGDESTDWVPAELHQGMAALFERLQMIVGPSDEARALGREIGGVVPFMWDEEDLDQRDAVPVDCVRPASTDHEDLIATMREFYPAYRAGRVSVEFLARRQHVTTRTIERAFEKIRDKPTPEDPDSIEAVA